MAALERLLEAFHKGYTHVEEGERSYAELLTRAPGDPPLSYRLKTWSESGEPGVGQQEYAQEITGLLIQLADEIIKSEVDLQKGSPRPRPTNSTIPLKGAGVKESLQEAVQERQVLGYNDRQ